MAILEAMGGKQSQQQKESLGATIQIPKENKALKSRPWTQLNPPRAAAARKEISTSTGAQQHAGTIAAMATSANTPAPPNNKDQLVQQQSDKDTNCESLQIECRPCASVGPESGARAFVMGPTPLSIVLCSNRLTYQTPEEMEQVLVHELVHIYDVRVQRLELRGGNCENLAYSEVRAAREAECKDAWLAGRYCIPQKAVQATANLFPAAQAKACMQRVFDAAMADTAPFATAPCATSSATTSIKRQPTFHAVAGMTPSER
jgi:hypothetical protein